MTLLADVNHPGSQEDMVSNWKPAHSLVEDTHLWDQDWSSHLPSNSGCHSPASLPPTEGREQRAVHSRLALLWYCLSPLFCEQHRLCFKAFCGKVLFFFFPPLWLSHTLGCCLNVSSLRLSSGHSGPVLTLCSLPLPVQPLLAGGKRKCLGYFSTGSCV